MTADSLAGDGYHVGTIIDLSFFIVEYWMVLLPPVKITFSILVLTWNEYIVLLDPVLTNNI